MLWYVVLMAVNEQISIPKKSIDLIMTFHVFFFVSVEFYFEYNMLVIFVIEDFRKKDENTQQIRCI